MPLSIADPLSLQELSDVVDAIYAAAADGQRWPDALLRVGQAVAGTQTLLFSGGGSVQDQALRCHQTADDVLFPFLAYYSSVNVLSEPCDRMFADGEVRFSHQAVPDSVFERSEFYQDFFRRNGLFYSFGIKQHNRQGATTYVSVQRPRRQRPFTPDEAARLALLMPHLQRALDLQNTLRHHAAAADAAGEALAAFGKVLIGVDGEGRIVYASPAAEQLLRDGGVVYSAAGTLRARHPGSDQQLQKRLGAVLQFDAGFVRGGQTAMLLRQPGANGEIRLAILPRRSVPAVQGVVVEALLCFSGWDPEAPARKESLRGLYKLTATECRVADLLLAGKEVKEIADVLRITANTARFHVKRILGKTGVRRQTELIRLMAELPPDRPA